MTVAIRAWNWRQRSHRSGNHSDAGQLGLDGFMSGVFFFKKLKNISFINGTFNPVVLHETETTLVLVILCWRVKMILCYNHHSAFLVILVHAW